MKNIILFLIFSLLTFFSEGQETTSSGINIRATTSVAGKEFFVDIFRNKDKIKVLYKIKEMTSNKRDADTTLMNYKKVLLSNKNLTLQNNTVSFYLEKMDSINQMYTTCWVDSLAFNRTEHKDFDNLLNSILSSSSEVLENKSANKSHLILDGTVMRFKLTDNNNSRIVYAYSPNSATYPLLTNLVKQSMELYRQIKNNDFLSVEKQAVTERKHYTQQFAC